MDLEEKEWRKETARSIKRKQIKRMSFLQDRVLRKTKKSTVSSDWLEITVN